MSNVAESSVAVGFLPYLNLALLTVLGIWNRLSIHGINQKVDQLIADVDCVKSTVPVRESYGWEPFVSAFRGCKLDLVPTEGLWDMQEHQEHHHQLNRIEHKLNVVLGVQLSHSRKLRQIMAEVKIDQAVLDADGQKLSALAVDLKSLIDSGNLSEADQTTLQAGLDSLTALDTVPVTPVPVDPNS
jgi:hypothetical protein